MLWSFLKCTVSSSKIKEKQNKTKNYALLKPMNIKSDGERRQCHMTTYLVCLLTRFLRLNFIKYRIASSYSTTPQAVYDSDVRYIPKSISLLLTVTVRSTQ